MASKRITDLTLISTIDTAVDPLPIVDISDTSQAASGTTKKVTVDQIESAIFGATGSKAIVVDNVAALKALTVASVDDGQVFLTRGYYSDNDGGQGTYIYDAASSTADNGGTVIAPTSGTGRYLLSVSGELNIKQFGAKGNGSQNDAPFIQAAIDSATSANPKIFFPAGLYTCSNTLIFKNEIIYQGAGRDFNGTFGTTIRYTGAGDAVQINNPINTATWANVVIRDLGIDCTTVTAKKASLAIVGGLYITISNVAFGGNAYGLILDQSLLVTVDNCDFQAYAAGSVACLWLVNGAGHTPGANTYWTNRITIRCCEFNGVTSANGVNDDGGTCHSFENNNFNALSTQLRVVSCRNINVNSNQFEGATTNVISFPMTWSPDGGGGVGLPSGNANIVGNFIVSGGTYSIQFTSNCLYSLVYSGNNFQLDSTGGYATPDNNPASFVNVISAFGNYNTGTGAAPYNNVNSDKTFNPVVGGNTTLGSGTYTAQKGRYIQNGNIVHFEIQVSWSAHTGSGTQMYVSLPKAVVKNIVQYIPVFGTSTGITLSSGEQLVPLINTDQTAFGIAGAIQLYKSSAGSLSPLALASSGDLYISGTYCVK